ncbi:MAG: hypothetical protein V1708_05205, partial [Candidatus Micrarchaeota archaeon]
MIDSIKLFVVSCGNCKTKQVWDDGTIYRSCNECDSAVVLRTASAEDLKSVKTELGAGKNLVFSNYFVYSLGPEDVERAAMERKARIRQLKEDVAERKVYAQSKGYAFYKRAK